MSLKQRKDKTRYKIRLSKAIKAQHSEYMFRLLKALNNMISLLSIRHCIDECSLPVYQREGTRSFVLDLEFGFLVEYLITFVEKIPEDVEEYLQQFPQVSSAFTELKSIIATQEFAKLRSLRNNFIFHLNYQDEGKRTKKALSQLLKTSTRSKKVRESANLVIRSTDPLATRFVTADELSFECLLMELGIPRNRDAHKSSELKNFRKFVLNTHRCFIKFAEGAVLSWVGCEELSFDYSKSG